MYLEDMYPKCLGIHPEEIYPEYMSPDGPASYPILPPSPEWLELRAEMLRDLQNDEAWNEYNEKEMTG